MKTRQVSRGFTLIELVIVVVILGLLAVTAIPRLLNITSQAEDASAEGVAGGFASAVGLARAQWEVEGRPAGNTDITLDGLAIDVGTTGYPTGRTNADETNIADADCVEVWEDILQSPPRITSASPIGDERYYVTQATEGSDRVCVFYQVASLDIQPGDAVPTAAQNGNDTIGNGFVYNPRTGQVRIFSNNN